MKLFTEALKEIQRYSRLKSILLLAYTLQASLEQQNQPYWKICNCMSVVILTTLHLGWKHLLKCTIYLSKKLWASCKTCSPSFSAFLYPRPHWNPSPCVFLSPAETGRFTDLWIWRNGWWRKVWRKKLYCSTPRWGPVLHTDVCKAHRMDALLFDGVLTAQALQEVRSSCFWPSSVYLSVITSWSLIYS